MQVPDPAPEPTAAAVCAALLPALPDRLLDQTRRTTEPGRLSVAWGRPAIVLRCGVGKPAGLEPTSQCFEVNGVGWFAEPAPSGFRFTTIGRPAYVEVTVPSQYAPEANALTFVSAAIDAHDPVRQPCV